MKYLKLRSTLLLLPVLVGSIMFAAPAHADDPGGTVEIMIDGARVALPALKTDISADIRGDLATVKVVQTFVNPGRTPAHAQYLFPLSEDAAVYAMTMKVGDRVVRAKIQEVEKARATFAKAKTEGKSAALLTQHRPNMFTQNLANLMPGLPIEVTLSYVQTLPRTDDQYQLVLPLVVGPRYQPPGSGVPPTRPANPSTARSDTPVGTWELEELPKPSPVQGLNAPASIDPARVSIHVTLEAGMKMESVQSQTHAIDVTQSSDQRAEVTLTKGRTIDNKDFVLIYQLAGALPKAGALSHFDNRGGFFSILIEPPAAPRDEVIAPREIVFVLDCSGSMRGKPMEASKAFMRRALRGLRSSDTFRIIRFSEAATAFSKKPLQATTHNIQRGLAYTEALKGTGGTAMTSGIRQALSVPAPDGSLRLVVFLTDGYIGNEAEVLSLVQKNIGDARIYALGVGTSVNRYLLSRLGKMGRGFTRYMDPTEEPDDVAAELAARIDAPVLTDITIDWGELKPFLVTPEPIPDLFAGQSIRVQGRYEASGRYEVVIQGRVRGRAARLPVTLDLTDVKTDGESIALIWARTRVAQLMEEMLAPRAIRARNVGNTATTDPDPLKKEITRLGLDFGLVTQWTSFVAVAEEVVNPEPDENTVTASVLVPQVEGVGAGAYGGTKTPAGEFTVAMGPSTPQFAGQSTPEPGTVGGLTLAVMALGAAARRRRDGAQEDDA